MLENRLKGHRHGESEKLLGWMSRVTLHNVFISRQRYTEGLLTRTGPESMEKPRDTCTIEERIGNRQRTRQAGWFHMQVDPRRRPRELTALEDLHFWSRRVI